MAISSVQLEGFDDGIVENLLGGWTGTGTSFLSTVTGRTGSAIRITRTQNVGGNTNANIVLPISMGANFAVSFVLRLPASEHQATNQPPGFLLNCTSGTFGIHWDTGVFKVYDGSTLGAGVIATSGAKDRTAWNYFEILVETGSPGNLTIKLGGAELYNAARTITSPTSIQFSAPVYTFNATTQTEVDDLALYNVDTSADLLGDSRVYTLSPDGNGTTNQGVGSDADSTDNYQLVDETTISTSDYVDLSSGQRDLYTVENLPFPSGIVHAVQPRMSSEKTDAGTIAASSVSKLGASENVATGVEPAFGSVDHIIFPAETTKPGGGNWTPADVNNAEFGVEAS